MIQDLVDDNERYVLAVEYTEHMLKLRRAKGLAAKRRKQAKLQVRRSNFVNEKALENEVQIKKNFASTKEESNNKKESDSDENELTSSATQSKVSKKIMFEKSIKTTDTGIKAANNETNKTIKPDTKDENSDELLTDSKLNQLRFHDPLPTGELKNAEALLRFARSSDKKVQLALPLRIAHPSKFLLQRSASPFLSRR